MQYFAFIAALAAMVAANSLQISKPAAGDIVRPGNQEIRWQPANQGPVTLLIRKCPPQDLRTVGNIASGIPYSGSYSWSVPSNYEDGEDYAIQIILDSNKEVTNYTPQFSIRGGSGNPSS